MKKRTDSLERETKSMPLIRLIKKNCNSPNQQKNQKWKKSYSQHHVGDNCEQLYSSINGQSRSIG